MVFLSGSGWIRGFLLSHGCLAFPGIQWRQVYEEDPDRGGLHLAGQGGHEEEGGELAQAVCQLHSDQPLSSSPRTRRFSSLPGSWVSDAWFIKTSERKVNSRVGNGDRFNFQFFTPTFTFFSFFFFSSCESQLCYGAVVVVCVWTSVKWSGWFTDENDFSFSLQCTFERFISKTTHSQKADCGD